ncbi:MAG: TIGR00730 family Rossman fold protein [Gemmatimonadetes bacterium]|nr:TIGR00730 family Rossman fold protein [Gemmatimonadota bacterium]
MDERLKRIAEHPSYRRADDDSDFLNRDEMRGTRLALDYLKPQLIQEEHGIESTIVVFGGTRVIERSAAEAKLKAAQRAAEAAPGDAAAARDVRIAERVLAKTGYYDVAREFGRLVGEAGKKDRGRHVIVTGGGPGIMEAANRGATDAGVRSIGLNITLPHEQFPNPYITPELCFQFRYFAIRKLHFALRAEALVAFPGGFGTLDELFELLTLIQTRTMKAVPVILVGEEFWRRVFNAEVLAEEGTISPADLELFSFAETAEEVWQRICDWQDPTA